MQLTGNVQGLLELIGAGDNVTISTEFESGTLLATFTLNDTDVYYIYAPEVITDYTQVSNKPSINGNELIGDKSTADLGLFSGNYDDLSGKPTLFSGSYNDLSDKPSIPQILNGVDAPDANLGNNGDLYIKYIGDATSYVDTDLLTGEITVNNAYTPIQINDSDYDAIRVVGYYMSRSFDQTMQKANIPTYNGSGYKNNIYNYNAFQQVGLSKGNNVIYVYKGDSPTHVTHVYKRNYVYLPTNIDKIYAKVMGVWITTT